MSSTILLLSSLLGVASHYSAPTTSKDKVFITAKSEKPTDGKRVVVLKLEIAKGWHMLANPVGNADLAYEQTRVSFTSSGKPVSAKIEYPVATRVIKDEIFGDYGIYEGTITIKATIAQTDDIEAILLVRTFNGQVCILPSKVQLKIE